MGAVSSQSLSCPRNQLVPPRQQEESRRRLRTAVVLNNGENFADCGTARNTGVERGEGRGAREAAKEGLEEGEWKRLEARASGNHPVPPVRTTLRNNLPR